MNLAQVMADRQMSKSEMLAEAGRCVKLAWNGDVAARFKSLARAKSLYAAAGEPGMARFVDKMISCLLA